MTNIGISTPCTIADPARAHLFPGHGRTPDLGYLAGGDPAGRTVMFIHGTPGAAVDWTPFLSNVPGGECRTAVDRPGFGRSDPRAPVVTLADPASAIAQLLAARPGPAVLVGSSYDGPVALQLAAGHREQVAGVLVGGSAGDPAHEAPHPLRHLAATGPLGRLLPRALRRSNAEAMGAARRVRGAGTAAPRDRDAGHDSGGPERHAGPGRKRALSGRTGSTRPCAAASSWLAAWAIPCTSCAPNSPRGRCRN